MARTRLPRTLSPRLRALMEPHLDPDEGRLSGIATVICGLRREAVDARRESGIEDVWLSAEEAYVGIDNANRHEHGVGRWVKSMSLNGPLTRNTSPPEGTGKSTIYVPITARYVDAGTAKLSEILLPLDGKSFSFSNTPLPDMIKLKESNEQVISPELGVPLFRDARPGEMPPPPAGEQPPPQGGPAAVPPPAAPPTAGGAAPPMMPGMPPPQVPLTAKDLAEEQIELAAEKAEKAEKRIYDWMVESQYQAEARKVIFDAGRLGVGVLKGPVPIAKREIATSKGKDGITVVIQDSVKPGCRWVDAWNFYPDPACGENIHDGDYCFERDFYSEHQVRNLLKQPGYIRSQLLEVIKGGPTGIRMDTEAKPNEPSESQARRQYEVWFYHGVLSGEDYKCICHHAGTDLPKGDVGEVFAIITMIGDRVVKAAFNPLDSGALPYHAMPWRRRPGSWAGIGIAEQGTSAQRITNGAVRAMMDNAGKSAGSQIVIDINAVYPADGVWAITPDKIWFKKSDTNMDVEESFGMFVVPNTTAPLNEIVQMGMRLFEETTNIPLVTQGQSGMTTPDTLGGMQLQNNNANQLLRQVASSYDDNITEPFVRQCYEYLLLDPDVPDDEKGDFQVDAKGSAALVERSIQDQMLGQMLGAALNPAYGIDPKRTMKEFLKSKRFDPRTLEFSEEEQKKIDETPPPAAPQIEVAKIRAATDEKRIGVQREDVLSDRTVALHELELRRELAILDAAKRENTSIATIKARLAETTMKLTVQRELADKAREAAATNKNGSVKSVKPQRSSPQVATPPVEPPGRAPDGQAYPF